MKIICMRHGQTSYNLLGLCNDDPGRRVYLTDTGRQQAQTAAEHLRHADIQKIFISQLPRTRQTAEIVNRYHSAPIEEHAELNDIRSGFDGRPVSEYMQAIAHDPFHTRIGDGESLLQHKARIQEFIRWLESQPHDQVLVVAHEETLRVFMAHYRGYSDEQMLPLSIANCEILEFET